MSAGTNALLHSLVWFGCILATWTEAAPVMKPMPFEDQYITEISAIDYPQERIEAYTDGGMVEYIRDRRAEPSPAPTYVEEVVTTKHAVMFRPIKEYITTTLVSQDDDDVIEIIRDKREAGNPGSKFWPVRESEATTRRPVRKGFTQAHREKRAEPSSSGRPYLKEYITSHAPYLKAEIITTVTHPVIYDAGLFVRPKRAGSGFFQQCLAKLLGVGIGVSLVAALIYYFWYRRLKRAREQGEEASDYEERPAHGKRRSAPRNRRDDTRGNNYALQASPG